LGHSVRSVTPSARIRHRGLLQRPCVPRRFGACVLQIWLTSVSNYNDYRGVSPRWKCLAKHRLNVVMDQMKPTSRSTWDTTDARKCNLRNDSRISGLNG
jgi:hypothetical protein